MAFEKKEINNIIGFGVAFVTSIVLFISPIIHFVMLFFIFKTKMFNNYDAFYTGKRGIFASYAIIFVFIYIMCCFWFYGSVMGF